MMTKEQKIIKAKVGLLELAKQLGNVSQACKMLGYSRDSFYLYGRLSHCKSILNCTAWPVANIYPTSPEKAGTPKWGIRSRTPL